MMFNRNISNLTTGMSEGFFGHKTSFDGSQEWDMLYDALEKSKVLQGTVNGVEPTKVNGITQESLTLFIGNIKGIILPEEVGEPRPKYLNVLVGAPVAFKVKQCVRGQNIVYLSRKDALVEMSSATWRELRYNCEELVKVIKEMNELRPPADQEASPEVRKRLYELGKEANKVGPVRTATVRAALTEGAFVDIGGVSAFLPVREISWGRVEDAREILKPGMCFDVKINRVDFDNAYVRVSLRALLPDPWENVPERYKKDGTYSGVIVRHTLNDKLVVELEPGVTVVCPKVSMQHYGIGDAVRARLNNINVDRRYMTGHIGGVPKWVG